MVGKRRVAEADRTSGVIHSIVTTNIRDHRPRVDRLVDSDLAQCRTWQPWWRTVCTREGLPNAARAQKLAAKPPICCVDASGVATPDLRVIRARGLSRHSVVLRGSEGQAPASPPLRAPEHGSWPCSVADPALRSQP